MKKKHLVMIILVPCVVVLLLVSAVLGTNAFLTNLIEDSSIVLKDQKFSSADEAIQAMENYERELNDTSLDFCPPYHVVYTFDYDANTIVFYSSCHDFDGEERDSYAVKILKHNEDGTLSFDSGFVDFDMREPDGKGDDHYFTNIETSKGKKSICFLYMPKDSDKDIYVDGVKAEKMLVSIQDQEFYICYATSDRDTLLSSLLTLNSDRHHIYIK